MDQLSNGHLGWHDVCDDFDTVVLVDDDGDVDAGMQRVEDAVKSGKGLPSRWVRGCVLVVHNVSNYSANRYLTNFLLVSPC